MNIDVYPMAKLAKAFQKLFGPDADKAADDPDRLQSIIDKLSAERSQAIDQIRALVPQRCQSLIDDDEAEVAKLDEQSDKWHRAIEKADLIIKELMPRMHAARDRVFREQRTEAISKHKAALDASFAKLKSTLQAAGQAQDEMIAVYEAAHEKLRRYGAQTTLPTRPVFNGFPTSENVAIFIAAVERELNPPVVEPNDSLRAVQFSKQVGKYAPGETASFPPQEAAALVDRGHAEWADRRPRPAPLPTIEGDGGANVPVRMRRSTYWKDQLFNVGEIAGFALADARALISSGAAEPVTPSPTALSPTPIGTPGAGAAAAPSSYIGLQHRAGSE